MLLFQRLINLLFSINRLQLFKVVTNINKVKTIEQLKIRELNINKTENQTSYVLIDHAFNELIRIGNLTPSNFTCVISLPYHWYKIVIKNIKTVNINTLKNHFNIFHRETVINGNENNINHWHVTIKKTNQ